MKLNKFLIVIRERRERHSCEKIPYNILLNINFTKIFLRKYAKKDAELFYF